MKASAAIFMLKWQEPRVVPECLAGSNHASLFLATAERM